MPLFILCCVFRASPRVPRVLGHWWHGYSCSASGVREAPFALNTSEWLANIFFLRVCLLSFSDGVNESALQNKTKEGVRFSIRPLSMLQPWVCTWLLGARFQLRLCSFSGKDALFSLWVKLTPPVFIPQMCSACIRGDTGAHTALFVSAKIMGASWLPAFWD